MTSIIVVDRLIIKDGICGSRVAEAILTSPSIGGHGELSDLIPRMARGKLVSSNHTCPICGFSVPKLEPRLFLFQRAVGLLPGSCKGLRHLPAPSPSICWFLIPSKSINQGAIRYYKNIRRDLQS
jgi:excinuclease ABC subunit A